MGKSIEFDEEGLPIPQKVKVPTPSVKFDDEGLPVPIKKKEQSVPSNFGSLAGKYGYTSEEGSISDALKTVKSSPETQSDINREQNYKAVTSPKLQVTQEEFDEDPVAVSRKVILSKMPSVKRYDQPKTSEQEERVGELSFKDGDKEIQTVKNFYSENTNGSIAHLSKITGINNPDLLYSDEFDEQIKQSIKPGNETDRLAYERLQDAKKARAVVRQNLEEGKSFEDMAIDYAAANSPEMAKVIQQLQSTPTAGEVMSGITSVDRKPEEAFDEATIGRFLYDFYNSSAIRQEMEKIPGMTSKVVSGANQLIQKYPSFGKMYLGSLISQKMEDMGMNNAILNVATKAERDKAVDALVAEGKMSPLEVQFYKDNIRSISGLGLLRRKITGNPIIDTPGALESTVGGAYGGFKNTVGGLYELTGLRESVLGNQGALREDLEKTNKQVSIKPKGTVNDIAMNAGQFFGQSMSIGLGGKMINTVKLAKDPMTVMGMVGATQAYANYLPQARMMFPGNELKQKAYAFILSGIEWKTEKIFNDRKVVDGLLGKLKPSVVETIKDFTEKKISSEAARANIQSAIRRALKDTPEAAKYFGKAVVQNDIEELSAELGGQLTRGIFENKPFDEWIDGEDLYETTKAATLGSPIIGSLSARADMQKNRGITAKTIYSMAQDPDYWKSQIMEGAKLDETLAAEAPDKIKNLEIAAKIVQELDATDLTEKQKVKFVITELEKQLKAEQSKDAAVQAIPKAAISELEKVQQDILDGKDDGSIEGDKSDDVNPDEKKLFDMVVSKAKEGYKKTLKAAETPIEGLEYLEDKYAENPVKFREDFGNDIADKIGERTSTEKLESAIDFLIQQNPDDPAIPVLDKLISERTNPPIDPVRDLDMGDEGLRGEEKSKVEEGSVGVGGDVGLGIQQGYAKKAMNDFINSPDMGYSIHEEGGKTTFILSEAQVRSANGLKGGDRLQPHEYTNIELTKDEKKQLNKIESDKELGDIDGLEYAKQKRALAKKIFERASNELQQKANEQSGKDVVVDEGVVDNSLKDVETVAKKHFSDEAILSAKEAENNNEGVLINMPIDDFLSLNPKGDNADKRATVSKLVKEGTKFNEIPFLNFTHDGNGNAEVTGHEGRHRAMELKAQGETTIPVLLRNRAGGQGEVNINKESISDTKNFNEDLNPNAEKFPTKLRGHLEQKNVVIDFPLKEQSLSKQESGGKAPVTKPEGKSDVVVDKASNVGGDVRWFGSKNEPLQDWMDISEVKNPNIIHAEKIRIQDGMGLLKEDKEGNVYTTKQPANWDYQLSYEKGKNVPSNIYIAFVKNPSTEGSEYGHETASPSNEVSILKYLGSLDDFRVGGKDSLLDNGQLDAIRIEYAKEHGIKEQNIEFHLSTKDNLLNEKTTKQQSNSADVSGVTQIDNKKSPVILSETKISKILENENKNSKTVGQTDKQSIQFDNGNDFKNSLRKLQKTFPNKKIIVDNENGYYTSISDLGDIGYKDIVKAHHDAQKEGYDGIAIVKKTELKKAVEQSLKEQPSPTKEEASVSEVNKKNESTQEATKATEPKPTIKEPSAKEKSTEDTGGAKEPPTGKEKVGEEGGRLNDKGILNKLYNAKRTPEAAKEGFKKEGLEYETKSQKEAQEVANALLDEAGIDEAVAAAEAMKFDGDVNSLIFAEALNRLKEQEDKATTPEAKLEAATRFAEVGITYDKMARYGGRFNAAINFFYQKSPLGIVMSENSKRKDDFNQWAKPKDKSWKEFHEEMMKDPEYGAIVKEQVSGELKKERAASREARKEKVHKSIDEALEKWNKKLSISDKDDVTGLGVSGQDKIFKAVGATMKKAYDAGEAIVKIVQDAIDYISKELKTDTWDKEEFRKEWEVRLGKETDKGGKINREKRIEYLKKELARIQSRKQKEKTEPTGTKREIPDEEQVLLDEIEAEQTKWDAEKDAARQFANDYQKLETERNRQLKRVTEINEKIDILRQGQLPETKKFEPKKDTPEIEVLKAEKDALETSVRQSIAHEKKMKDLDSELQRLKDRKEKEPKPDSKRIISEDERLKRDEIEAERKAWAIEDNIKNLKEELQRVQSRQKKVTTPLEKRELTDTEKDLVNKIKAEKALWAKEVEPERKLRAALKAAQDSFDEYQRRINGKDISTKESDTHETPQLKELREKRDAKRKEYEAMKKEMTKPTEEELDTQRKQRVLDKFRNKLKGLSDKQKEEVVVKAHRKIIESGGLDYQDFKDIIAGVLGRGELTPQDAAKIKELVAKTNEVQKAAEKLREERTDEAFVNFRKAEVEAGKATKELNELFYNKPDIIKRLTSIMQLSTLGIPALINNPIYNLWNQATLRFPVGLVNDLVDRGMALAAKTFGKNYEREYNVLETQVEFWEKLGFGAKEAISQLFTGLNRQDYLQKEVYGQQIRPVKAFRDLIEYTQGKRKLSKTQMMDKAIQSTIGIPAEIVARTLNLGDKPQRFAAEGSQASAFAKTLGLQGMDYKLFVEFPREEAYRAYKAQGLSDEVAAEKADYVKEAILKEGQRSTFQQDNILNDVITRAASIFGGKDSGTANLVKTLTISPYIKIPSNAFWSFYNLLNPEVAILQTGIHAGRAKAYGNKGETVKSKLQQREARYWMAHAIVGMAMRAAVIALVKAGVFTPGSDEDDSKKERDAVSYFDKPGSVTIGDVQISNRWFGQWGMMGNAIARKYRDATPEQRLAQDDFWNVVLGGMEREGLKELQNGIFANTSSILQSVDSGNPDRYLTNTLNMLANIVQPAAIAQINRASLDEVPSSKGDNFLDKLNKNFAQRSVLYRKAFGVQIDSKRDVWGQTIPKGGNILSRLFGISRINPQLFARPIYNDYLETNDSGFLPPAVLPVLDDIKLDTKQYDRLQYYIGEERKRLVEPYVNDMAIIEGFNTTYDDIKDPEDKKFVLQYLYNEGRDLGVEKFYQDFPELKKEKPAKDYGAEIKKDLFKILSKYGKRKK